MRIEIRKIFRVHWRSTFSGEMSSISICGMHPRNASHNNPQANKENVQIQKHFHDGPVGCKEALMDFEMALKPQCILVFVDCACCLCVPVLSVSRQVTVRATEGWPTLVGCTKNRKQALRREHSVAENGFKHEKTNYKYFFACTHMDDGTVTARLQSAADSILNDCQVIYDLLASRGHKGNFKLKNFI